MSHSCDEYYEVYDEETRRARAEHRCAACREPIAKGDSYTYVSIVFDGEAESVKRCTRCQAMHEHLRELAPGEMWPAEKLDCGESYRAHWQKDPPEHIAALAFWRPGDPLPKAVP